MDGEGGKGEWSASIKKLHRTPTPPSTLSPHDPSIDPSFYTEFSPLSFTAFDNYSHDLTFLKIHPIA